MLLKTLLCNWRFHCVLGDFIVSLKTSLCHWRLHCVSKDFIVSLETSLNSFIKNYIESKMLPELGTLEWWISGLMLNPLFLLISRLT